MLHLTIYKNPVYFFEQNFLSSFNSLTSLQKQGLRSLNLSQWYQFTDEDLENLPPGLLALNLSFTPVVALNRLPPELKVLGLSFCLKLTDDALNKIPPGLEKLCLKGNPKLTQAAVARFQNKLVRIIFI